MRLAARTCRTLPAKLWTRSWTPSTKVVAAPRGLPATLRCTSRAFILIDFWERKRQFTR